MISTFLLYNVGGLLYRLPKIPAERDEAAAFRMWHVIKHNHKQQATDSLAILESQSKQEAYSKYQRCEFSLEK